tara:strand:+ start:478 stop:630 length:153 start_codon:yes stop_codon:yes gene_type:complete
MYPAKPKNIPIKLLFTKITYYSLGDKLNKITSLKVPSLILGPHGPDPEET